MKKEKIEITFGTGESYINCIENYIMKFFGKKYVIIGHINRLFLREKSRGFSEMKICQKKNGVTFYGV